MSGPLAAPESREYPRRWTADEYFGLVHQGVLRPDDRVELLEGLIVAMSPQNPRHAGTIDRIYRTLARAIGDRAVIRSQLPLVLGDRSVPEPDFAIVPRRSQGYFDDHPRTAVLVIEVADSSLVQDGLTKATIYASAGIPEYWIVNLVDDRIDVLLEPRRKNGRYLRSSTFTRGDRIGLSAFPGTSVATKDLLPPLKRRKRNPRAGE